MVIRIKENISVERIELTEEEWAVAAANKIPKVTVYKRLQRGWSLEDAITKPTRKTAAKRNKSGLFEGKGKGKARAFQMPAERDEELDAAIAASGLSQSEFCANIIAAELDRLQASTE